MSFHRTHKPYFTPTQRHIPPLRCSFPGGSRSSPLGLDPCPHSLTFLSPDTLDGGFPSGPTPSGSAAPLTSNSPKSSGRGPLCSGGRTVWHTCFSVGASVFSLQTQLSQAAPSLEGLRLTTFTQLFLHFIHLVCGTWILCGIGKVGYLTCRHSISLSVCFHNVNIRALTAWSCEFCSTSSGDHKVLTIFASDLNQSLPTFCWPSEAVVKPTNYVANERTESTGFLQ